MRIALRAVIDDPLEFALLRRGGTIAQLGILMGAEEARPCELAQGRPSLSCALANQTNGQIASKVAASLPPDQGRAPNGSASSHRAETFKLYREKNSYRSSRLKGQI